MKKTFISVILMIISTSAMANQLYVKLSGTAQGTAKIGSNGDGVTGDQFPKETAALNAKSALVNQLVNRCINEYLSPFLRYQGTIQPSWVCISNSSLKIDDWEDSEAWSGGSNYTAQASGTFYCPTNKLLVKPSDVTFQSRNYADCSDKVIAPGM